MEGLDDLPEGSHVHVHVLQESCPIHGAACAGEHGQQPLLEAGLHFKRKNATALGLVLGDWRGACLNLNIAVGFHLLAAKNAKIAKRPLYFNQMHFIELAGT